MPFACDGHFVTGIGVYHHGNPHCRFAVICPVVDYEIRARSVASDVRRTPQNAVIPRASRRASDRSVASDVRSSAQNAAISHQIAQIRRAIRPLPVDGQIWGPAAMVGCFWDSNGWAVGPILFVDVEKAFPLNLRRDFSAIARMDFVDVGSAKLG